MATRTVTIPEDLGILLDDEVRAGAYDSADALVADAVRAFVTDVDHDIEALRELISDSLADTNPNISADDVWASLKAQSERRRARS